MTRFWITLEQGVKLVINGINNMKGGEIFIPKIASMNIVDLADTIAPKAEKKVIGIRAGEKIHEILITEDEARHSKEFDDFFVIEPEHTFWAGDKKIKGGKKLPEGFRYTSENNTKWYSKKDLMNIIKEL